MSDTIGYSLEDLRNSGYPLLADFLFEAPNNHPYARIFKKSTNPPEDFINRLSEKGGFAQGLLSNDIGEAAIHADNSNTPILHAVINGSTRYAVVSPDEYSEGFTQKTVPAEWMADN